VTGDAGHAAVIGRTGRTRLDVAPAESGFGLAILPYGIFSTPASPRRRVGVAVGDDVLDLAAAARDSAGTVRPAGSRPPRPS
jgi:fumarylacetoacetase